MAQRYVLRLETSTGNVYGDGDQLLCNMDDLLLPADEGKPWVKTAEYIESATPTEYKSVERSKYYGIAGIMRPSGGTGNGNTLPIVPIKPGEFDVANALHPSAKDFSRPAVSRRQFEQHFPEDVLHDVGDCMYITSALSFSTNLVIEPDGTSGNAKRVFYGNLDISDAFTRDEYQAFYHPLAYCPFHPSINTTGEGGQLLSSFGSQGIVYYSLEGAKEELIFYADKGLTQARDPINLQEETRSRVNIVGQVKMEVVDKNGRGQFTVKGTTSYYTSGGVLLASFDWEKPNVGYKTIHFFLSPIQTGINNSSIPNIIVPGIRIHHLSVTTEPVDPELIFPKKNYLPFLDGNGLATAWDITKKWVNKYKQDKLTAGNNITIENNVISASGGGESVDLTDYAKKSEIPDVSGLQPKLTAGNNITIVDNVISATGSGGEGGSVDLSNYYTKAEVETLISNIVGVGTQEVLRYTNVADDIVSSKIIVEDLVDDSVNTFTSVESADEVEIV